MATNDTPPHTELSSVSLVTETPVKPRQAPHNVPHAYPTPQSAKKQPAWTSSDLDTPRPGGTQAEEPRSKKRTRDAAIVYVDSGSDSEKVVQTPSKKKARKTGTGGGKSTTKRGDASSGRKVGSWTKEEIRALWDAIFVPPTRIDWEGVSAQVALRDKLSCSNKWRYDLLPKVQAYIDSLGE